MRSSDNGILKFHLAEINNTQSLNMMLAYVCNPHMSLRALESRYDSFIPRFT